MEIVCGLCGKMMATDVELRDGQHVICPHCGGKSAYVRCKLSKGQKTRPSRMAEEDRARMISRQMDIADDHLRFIAKMADNDIRRKSRERRNVVLMFVAIVVCVVGGFGYVGYWRSRERQRALRFAEEMSKQERERQESFRRTCEQLKQERLAAEQRRAERRKEEEERFRQVREEMRMAEEKRFQLEAQRRKEERVASDMRLAEEERSAAKRKEDTLSYRKADELLKSGGCRPFECLSPKFRPGKESGEFYFLLPFLDKDEIAVCRSSTNGVVSVDRLSASGERTELAVDKFMKMLRNADYLMVRGRSVYFHSKRRNANLVRLDKTRIVSLFQDYFGDIAAVMKERGICPVGVKFEIVFKPSATGKDIVVDTIGVYSTYSFSKVRAAIEKEFPNQVFFPPVEMASFKKSVVLWEGAMIKQGIDGITYVPRFLPRPSRRHCWCGVGRCGMCERYEKDLQNYERWKSLYVEAVEQEDAARRYSEDSRKRKLQERSERSVREYTARIDKIYDSGNLYYRVKFDGR